MYTLQVSYTYVWVQEAKCFEFTVQIFPLQEGGVKKMLAHIPPSPPPPDLFMFTPLRPTATSAVEGAGLRKVLVFLNLVETII